MNHVPIEEMTKEDLLEAYNVLRTKRGMDPLAKWDQPRERMVQRIESMESKRRTEARRPVARLKKKAKPKAKGDRKLGVGKYVRELLMEEVGRTPDGQFPVGHSYEEILNRVRERFPDSAVDPKHVRWYCTKMREKGQQPPVYRGRSKWGEGDKG